MSASPRQGSCLFPQGCDEWGDPLRTEAEEAAMQRTAIGHIGKAMRTGQTSKTEKPKTNGAHKNGAAHSEPVANIVPPPEPPATPVPPVTPPATGTPEMDAAEERMADKDDGPRWVPRTLADLKTEPLSYVVPPYLPDMGTTVLYGKGGVGKGFTALHWAQQIARTDRRVAILDWEHHSYEWDERSYQFGFTKADRLAIHYYDPFSGEDYWPAFIDTGSLRHVASDLRELFDQPDHYVDYVIVDSFFAATSGAEAMGGQRDAKDFHEALKILGRPALFLAHTADSLERFPRKPFGSVHVTSAARMTWAMEKASLDRDDTPERYESSLVLELRNMKQSRGPEAAPQFLRFMWDKAKNIDVDTKRPSTLSISYLAHEVLGRAEEPLSAKDIAAALKDTGQSVSAEVLYATMNRNFDRFMKVSDKKGRARWTLKSDDAPAEPDVDAEETA